MDFDQLVDVKRDATSQLQELGKEVLDLLSPPPGPYAFFAHNAHALEGLEDVQRILTRLFRGRETLTQLSHEEDAIKPRADQYKPPIPDDFQRLLQQQHELSGHMKMDLESLYIFGGVLLDQWSLQALYLGGLINKKRKQYPFARLVELFEQNVDTPLNPLGEAILPRAIWLYWQLRFYRNRFIIHANRPWQRGTTRSVYGNDFNLHTPTPPGWLSEAEEHDINKEARSYLHLAPPAIRDAPDDWWQKESPRALLEVLFNHIGDVADRDQRERIGYLFGQVGGSLPTFQDLAENLLLLIRDGARSMKELADQLRDQIDLGLPAR